MTATFSRGSLAVIPFYHFAPFTQFPEADQLGSVTVGMAKVRNRPVAGSPIVGMEDFPLDESGCCL
jgi:hypothetical protein